MLNYTVLPTLGPASRDEKIWSSLRAAGATAFRLNTSHLSLPELEEWLERFESFRSTCENPPGLVLDLQGSKWRVGKFNSFVLEAGQTVQIVLDAETDVTGALPVPHADFFRGAAPGAEVALNDAKIRLEVVSVTAEAALARVKQGGEISARKGISLVNSDARIESLSAKDQAIFGQTRRLPWVRYAISYIKDAQEMKKYRQLFSGEGFERAPYLIAKIERAQAVEQAAEICAFCDELWLCRGDLGSELGIPSMAEAAHAFSERVRDLPRPTLLAGQVLEHMAAFPAPTRSEVCCLYDALRQGYAGVVLSDETAVGAYPLESVRAAAMFRTGGG